MKILRSHSVVSVGAMPCLCATLHRMRKNLDRPSTKCRLMGATTIVSIVAIGLKRGVTSSVQPLTTPQNHCGAFKKLANRPRESHASASESIPRPSSSTSSISIELLRDDARGPPLRLRVAQSHLNHGVSIRQRVQRAEVPRAHDERPNRRQRRERQRNVWKSSGGRGPLHHDPPVVLLVERIRGRVPRVRREARERVAHVAQLTRARAPPSSAWRRGFSVRRNSS